MSQLFRYIRHELEFAQSEIGAARSQHLINALELLVVRLERQAPEPKHDPKEWWIVMQGGCDWGYAYPSEERAKAISKRYFLVREVTK